MVHNSSWEESGFKLSSSLVVSLFGLVVLDNSMKNLFIYWVLKVCVSVHARVFVLGLNFNCFNVILWAFALGLWVGVGIVRKWKSAEGYCAPTNCKARSKEDTKLKLQKQFKRTVDNSVMKFSTVPIIFMYLFKPHFSRYWHQEFPSKALGRIPRP